ncbi:hypothetical protein DSO57_1030007 [Entomophthora muscae]|uniref:Uncharacterized protein n=1 Tax=Entomophthora muscae TaxID=34485 RepID=A0ACC2TN19_9FUNG|nr:hypothetical protein DSO57_1030007 [Entomophthora muscae]
MSPKSNPKAAPNASKDNIDPPKAKKTVCYGKNTFKDPKAFSRARPKHLYPFSLVTEIVR